MAVDKEMLLQRLQTQYLTRQEVLYKLPLNISINTFWPELVDRRKMNSVMLPLHRGDGKPYWYVLTDKMIAASEKLCSLALDCSDTIDPYRIGLTSAMTEEMFFTSFVEGAQISLQEAMQFLERGTEPENVQEQLIQNNRSAWSDMIKMLFYPLDERYVRSLAFRLTSEMEGQANDYRQTDDHMIAAMGGETYEIPAATNIPALMKEYYAFLASTEVHPLIKAAVGQAYLLVARPFPDGNERLSRMISYAILLRSGYDFFRDISISGMIAQENYRYYKSMQDIIRSENGGDMTYFIEYYLDLLARAVLVKEEQQRKRHDMTLQAERQASSVPLSIPMQQVLQTESPQPVMAEKTERSEPENKADGCTIVEAPSPPTMVIEQAVRQYSVAEYTALLAGVKKDQMGKIQQSKKDRIIGTLLRLATEGPHEFTRLEWESLSGASEGVAKDDCVAMVKLNIVGCLPYKGPTSPRHYYLPLHDHTEPTKRGEPEAPSAQIQMAIQDMLQSDYIRERQSAEGLLDMINCERYEFTFTDWVSRNPVPNKDVGFAQLRVAMNRGLLEFDGSCYRFPQELKQGPKCFRMPGKQRDILLRLMTEFPDTQFTARDATENTGVKYSTITYYLDSFVQRGILTMQKAPGNINRYAFSSEIHGIFEPVETDGENTVFKELPEAEKRVHDPFRGMSDVG